MSRAKEINTIASSLFALWEMKQYDDVINILHKQPNQLEGALLGVALANQIGE